MKCILPGTNARVFAKAVHSLARIGSELFIEATPEGLSMRTVNNTKSAFALFKFFPSFFLDYDVNCDSRDEFENKCKVSMKAYLGVFKNMKQVEHCKLMIDSKNLKLVVQLKCRLETLKTHSISIIDVETLQAVYFTDNVPNKITANYKLFGEISSNFQMNEEEITLEASNDNLIVKNYVEGSHVDKRFMRSQLALKADEFDKYSVKEETSITFCLREFRAFLSFAEAINMDMLLHFDVAGRPVVFILNNLQTFEANLVMSTLSPDITTCENVPSQNKSINDTRLSNATQKRNNTKRDDQTVSKKTRIDTENHQEEQQHFTFRNESSVSSVEPIRAKSSSEAINPVSLSSRIYDKTNAATTNENCSNDANEDCSGIYVTFKTTGEVNQPCDESIPKSPTSVRRNRTRKIFKRCFEATFNPKAAETSNQILARNSDTED